MSLTNFDEWWEKTGKSIDPDTEDVPWYDKRKELARMAYEAGDAGSGNYVADDDTYPTKITFANGRVVRSAGAHGKLFLVVEPLKYGDRVSPVGIPPDKIKIADAPRLPRGFICPEGFSITGQTRLPLKGEFYLEWDGVYQAGRDFVNNEWPIVDRWPEFPETLHLANVTKKDGDS